MDREDFGTLLPGNEPSDYVMELMAFATAWTQTQLQETSHWSLPVHFSDFVLGVMLRLKTYSPSSWMIGSRDRRALDTDNYGNRREGKNILKNTTNLLNNIYVQMKEMNYTTKEELNYQIKEPHLYLMVVDIPRTKIWLFDSFPNNDAAKGRIYAATAMARVLDHIIRVGFHDIEVLGKRPPLDKWEPEFVLDVPNMGNPYKDKLWILLWLQMEQYFAEGTFSKPKSHIGNVSNKVRMDTALALVDDHLNELRTGIKARARKDWDDRRVIPSAAP
ncbi:hypothetical protein PIB30_000349 [Stylosanthes scabra]|uniref:Uncharacterized protein n=1 Tax=Stylosanthes scabra TaxID=79078 RepID=A0ABU6U130_9FABA|nr:hypothetical protein [Stylosanthes scabra]